MLSLIDDDDDIDEDELDKLVDLAEEDLNNTTSRSESAASRTLNTTENCHKRNDLPKVSQKCHKPNADPVSVALPAPLVATPRTTPPVDSAVESALVMDVSPDPQSMYTKTGRVCKIQIDLRFLLMQF